MSSPEADCVFLVDVDNTLLDNDRIQADIRTHLAAAYGEDSRDRYAQILQQLWDTLGYRDYLGALQRYRSEHPLHVELMAMAQWLLDYPFAQRLYPGALQVLARFSRAGPVVILSDGDVVFQPHKVQRAGIAAAVDGRVLIYIHKEQALDDVRRRHPARHYVLVDDKPRILAAVKQQWGESVTTVMPRQGQYAHDSTALAAGPAPDLQIDSIAELLTHDAHLLARRSP
ncbi:MAG: HAD family hydrolase [Burkholderiales bacterium]|nr:HAD family hydrolase [Burkholderiales bacterium]